jgi:hypothetical protein
LFFETPAMLSYRASPMLSTQMLTITEIALMQWRNGHNLVSPTLQSLTLQVRTNPKIAVAYNCLHTSHTLMISALSGHRARCGKLKRQTDDARLRAHNQIDGEERRGIRATSLTHIIVLAQCPNTRLAC